MTSTASAPVVWIHGSDHRDYASRSGALRAARKAGVATPHVVDRAAYDAAMDRAETDAAAYDRAVDASNDDMTGASYLPTPRRAYRSRDRRLFLSHRDLDFFAWRGHEVRVVTLHLTSKADKIATPSSKVSIFGHRSGLIGTRRLGNLPPAVQTELRRMARLGA